MRNYEFLFASFAVVWIGIAGYVGFVAVRLNKVAERIDKLEKLAVKRDGA